MGAALMVFAAVPDAMAQRPRDGMDPVQLALLYHKLTGDPLDLRAVAEASETVRRATNFDKPDAVKAEMARLSALLAAAGAGQEFTASINDRISEYDRDRGEFSITLLTPGYYMPVQAFGQEYQVVFANAERLRAIPMAKDSARDFDTRLNGMGRSVLDEIRFRIIGQGDPAGAVTGARVVRAEILSARLLDAKGRLVYAPHPSAAAADAAAGATGGPTPLDLSRMDVAGFRVGVKVKDLEATLTRLVGPATRRAPGKDAFPALAGAIGANEDGCYTSIGRRENPGPGAVCVTAFFDGDDVVRSIRVERLFPWFDAEVFRKTLTGRYGAVAGAQSAGDHYALGWGPEVDPTLVFDRSGPHTALAAYYATDQDFMGRSGNAVPRIRIVLQLVDAEWASQHSK
jgi:hypothetical protein